MSSDNNSDEDVAVIIDEKPYPNIIKNPLHQISLTSYILGALMGVTIGILPLVSFKNFNFYLAALSLFHFLEFYITAKYNPGKVHSESFLINNGAEYLVAHTFAIVECLIEYLFYPNWKSTNYSFSHRMIVLAGMIMLTIGQITRTIAMCTAGKSFSHVVKTSKISDHELVTNGIYSIFRHPSYFGFFWWALGTQAVLLNPIGFITFALVLWKFFSKRIAFEEQFLIKFFGEKYVEYKKRVPVRIPFIK